MKTQGQLFNIAIFILLSFIWGSSFILIKEGMGEEGKPTLTAVQVASIRLLSAGLVLLPSAIKKMRQIPYNKLGYIILSGFLGSFLPAFLFCIAETKVDSSLAGILNALTPICTIIIGILLFKNKVNRMQVVGVFVGFTGLCILFISKGNISFTYFSYALLIVIATICYGLNVNMVTRYLHDTPPLTIATFAFISFIIPSSIILWSSGYFNLNLYDNSILLSTSASALLGIGGTALATILFYVLLKNAGAVFASMVTYGIPFVAIFWGIMAEELISVGQIIGLTIILGGVYYARK